MTLALDALRRGEPAYGLTLTYPQPAIAELAIWSGYDFLLIDGEHGAADEAAQLDVLRTAAGTRSFCLVRVRPGDEGAIARYLDFGADGVLVPNVRDAAQARRIAAEARGRWTGGLRGDRYAGPAGTPPAAALTIALIESAEGIGNVEAILDVDGIDGVIVGSGDLSTDLGIAGQFEADAYLTAVAAVETAARARGKILGGKPETALPLSALLARGYRLILAARDMPLIGRAFGAQLAALRAASDSAAPDA